MSITKLVIFGLAVAGLACCLAAIAMAIAAGYALATTWDGGLNESPLGFAIAGLCLAVGAALIGAASMLRTRRRTTTD
jgi:hypothetical protein